MGAEASATGCFGGGVPVEYDAKIRKYEADDHHGLPGCGTCSVAVPRAMRDNGRMEVIGAGELEQDRIDSWMTQEGYYAAGTCSGMTASTCGLGHDTMAPSEYHAQTPEGAAIKCGPDQFCWLEEEEEFVSVGVPRVVNKEGFARRRQSKQREAPRKEVTGTPRTQGLASDVKTCRGKSDKGLASERAGWRSEPEAAEHAATDLPSSTGAGEAGALAASHCKHDAL